MYIYIYIYIYICASVERALPHGMVVTVPLWQPCTTAWSYVHNGFRAAGEPSPPVVWSHASISFRWHAFA